MQPGQLQTLCALAEDTDEYGLRVGEQERTEYNVQMALG